MAAFLINETGLSKRAIGDYLGEKYLFLIILNFLFFLINRNDFHIEVLKQYAHMHDFFGKDIVDGLR